MSENDEPNKEPVENKKSNDKAWHRALLILGCLVSISLITVIILLEFFPSEITTQIEQAGITGAITGGAGLFLLVFFFYQRAYIKFFNMLLALNCFLFAAYHYFEIKHQMALKDKETKALRLKVERLEKRETLYERFIIQTTDGKTEFLTIPKDEESLQNLKSKYKNGTIMKITPNGVLFLPEDDIDINGSFMVVPIPDMDLLPVKEKLKNLPDEAILVPVNP